MTVYVIIIHVWVSKETCLEVNDEKTKYIVTSCEVNERQNHKENKCDKSFESVAELEYLKTI
jgi:uncharacterized protein related to proFAR isomerase